MLRLTKKTKTRPFVEINVVPYIDVMLVLLVIFMITAPLLSQGVHVELPKAASTEALKKTGREPLIVSVNRAGQLFLNLQQNPEAPIEANALILRVAAELRLAKEAGQTLPVLVKGDQGVAYGKVVEAMGYLKKAGAVTVGLVTDTAVQPAEGQG